MLRSYTCHKLFCIITMLVSMENFNNACSKYILALPRVSYVVNKISNLLGGLCPLSNDLWQSMNYDIQHVYLEQYILSNRYNCRLFISRQYFPCHKLYSPYPFSCNAFFYKSILNISECICNRIVESNLLWLAFFNKWIRNCKYVILPSNI